MRRGYVFYRETPSTLGFCLHKEYATGSGGEVGRVLYPSPVLSIGVDKS